MKQYSERRLTIIAAETTTTLAGFSAVLAKRLNGKVETMSASKAIIRLGSRFAWKMLGFWGSKGGQRIPMCVTLMPDKEDSNSINIAIAFDAGTPEFHFSTINHLVNQRLDEVMAETKQLTQNNLRTR